MWLWPKHVGAIINNKMKIVQQVCNTNCICNALARKMGNIKFTGNVFKGSLQYAGKAAQLTVRKALTPLAVLWFSALLLSTSLLRSLSSSSSSLCFSM